MTVFIFLGSLIGAMALGMPIAMALLVCGVALMLQLGTFDSQILAQNLIGGADSFPLMAMPFFMLAGELMNAGGLSRRIIALAVTLIGHVRGGLGYVAVLAALVMASISGSAVADTAALAAILLPMMKQAGYNLPRAAGLISAGGIIAPVIPPSIGFVVFGVAAGVSITRLFIAGIVPGIVLTICYAATAVIICLKDPQAGPKGEKFPMREKLKALLGVLPVLILFIMVLGGILFGWCSATEGGAVGAFGALIFLAIRKKFTWKNIVACLKETAETTAMIFLIMIGSDILSQFFALTNISSALATFATTANVSPWLILMMCLLIYAILGCFVDSLPLICLLTPIFLPVIRLLGFNDMWFGVLMVMLMELGLMTPPVGMCCYVMAGITKGTTSLGEIFKGTAPFLIGILVAIVIVMLFPSLATWLPSLIRGG